MSLPDVNEVRSRIEHVPDVEMRMCLKTSYLYGARISEVVGVSSPSDETLARGPTGRDVRFDDVGGEPCVIFTVRTAKRGGLTRLIALPLSYEPWAKEVAQYFQRFRSDRFVFPFTRQKASHYVVSTQVFSGLNYPIEKYKISLGQVARVVDRHLRPYNIHALRHSRATELVEYFGFDGFDLSIYLGWTLTSSGVAPSASRYLSLDWLRYFHKLLKGR